MRISDWSSDVCSSDLKALTRRERHEELIDFAVEGAVQQVQRAHEIADGKGAININVLWEMGGAQRVLHGDRKSVVSGKSVSVRVDHGGRRRIKKKKETIQSTINTY